jgi:hypothetical protein
MKWNESKIPSEETHSIDLGFADNGYGTKYSTILVKSLAGITNDVLGAICPDCVSPEELLFQIDRIKGELDTVYSAAVVEYEASRD